ncbi:hypothetical protein CTAYLR_006002 [Chrysophaeum taylorii]|uniref:Thioesterase n=1 Tax=Chrysophaeum taylorii TaxID=2483200 RepID=A0AAD7U553_9STRA|nr:hypothetical protein CTAYLR_006002 [Chrysophaeum taylorii]
MSLPPSRIALSASLLGGCTWLAAMRLVKKSRVAALLGAGVAVTLGMDGAHFVRMALGDLSRVLRRLPRRSVLEEDRARFRVWPSDIDRNGHCNNAKFVRVANYARRSFWARCGAWAECLRHEPKVNLIVTATTIRYRRELKLFDSYEVVSRLRYWDAKCFYTEHRFVKDDFVHAIQHVKYRVVGSGPIKTPADLLRAVSSDTFDSPPSLDAMPELQAWIQYDAASSAALRPSTP